MSLRSLGTLLFGLVILNAHAAPVTSHGIALHGNPKYPAGFKAFAYVNPAAPKGGDVRLEAAGTFNSLNPFINKGVPAEGIFSLYDTLTLKSDDEPFSEYGLLAEKIERDPADKSWIIFHLNPAARFSDGKPVTADDVVFTFNIIRKDGDPQYKAYYSDVAKVEALDGRRVKFSFRDGRNPELQMIVGQLPILPKHYWEKRDFNTTSLEIPVGSGPYVIERIDNGRSITYRRNPSYWGVNLPVNRGRNNFDRMTYLYYRDRTVSLEGFKAGQFDFRVENKAKTWAVDYNFPAVKAGNVKKLMLPNENPSGMQGFVFNLRRPLFQDVRVRQALGYAYDFEWANKTMFYGAYTRTRSYFDNSELAARGLPTKEELALLEPFRKQLPASVFGPVAEPPKTDGSGNIRANLMQAQQLLAAAGWQVRNGKLTDKSGRVFAFELLNVQAEMERVIMPFAQNLKRLGIDMKIRTVDVPQYIERERRFDFDMVIERMPQSLSPGNEQRGFWTSAYANQPGSRNLMGIRSPVVDALVDQIISAPDREQLVARTRALDRVLLAGHYVIPQYHIGSDRLAYWDFFERPAVKPRFGTGFDTWWVNPQKQARIRALQAKGQQ
ncbi:MAG TPA: extracellular solute-binding protein [Moraxellaceae bacterium]|nr:extracellular solute-binding protein [Moraxellaceae bacterium]